MALLEKHRSVIYAHLVQNVGEEAAEAMLAQFPSRDVDEPATKEFVALQIAELRTEMILHMDRLANRLQIVVGTGFAGLALLITFAR